MHYLLSQFDGDSDLNVRGRPVHVRTGNRRSWGDRFLGDSNDVEPPMILNTAPDEIHAGGLVGLTSSFTVEFSEAINSIDANARQTMSCFKRGPTGCSATQTI